MKILILSSKKKTGHLIAMIICMVGIPGLLNATELPSNTKTGTETEAVEAEPEIEPWMTTPEKWSDAVSKLYSNEAEEAEMAIETWMLNVSEESWNSEALESIPLESWMCNTNDSFWETGNVDEEEIVIENWMLNPSEWDLEPDYLASF